MKCLLGTAVLVGITSMASVAGAQEIQLRGPLAGASSVSHLVRYREGRFSLTPTFGVTLQDQFTREMFVGLRAEYNLTDWLAVGAWGAFAAAHIDTALTDNIAAHSPGGTANVPNPQNFPQQIGQRNWMADLHLTFIPLRGKFALFQNLVADVDFFLFAGAAAIGISERQSTDGEPGGGLPTTVNSATQAELYANQIARDSRIAFAPTFGAGLNFFINHFISVNVEYRAFPFSWNASGTDENSTIARCGAQGNQACSGFSDTVATYFETNAANQQSRINATDRSFQFDQMVNFGVTFYFTRPRVGP